MLMVARGVSLLFLATAFIGFLVGLYSYFGIFSEARRQGRGFWDLYFFGAFRYAFREMKGSPQTRRMLLGWGVMVASFLLTALSGALVESLAK